jgi:DNA-binding GntR family transcriptional regulator
MSAHLAAERGSRSTDRVYEQIKLMAMTYAFLPGEHINEVELARQLQVSRTPVREALNRLSSEGFTSMVPNRGFFGRLLDATEIYNLFEYRCALEQAIFRLACERASDEALDELDAFVEALRKQDTESREPTLDRLRQDEEFHVRIARMTGNPEFVRALEAVNSRIHFVRWIDLRKRGTSTDGHARIARVLRQRDPDRCASDLEALIRRRREEIMEVIKDGVVEIYVGRAAGQPGPATR